MSALIFQLLVPFKYKFRCLPLNLRLQGYAPLPVIYLIAYYEELRATPPFILFQLMGNTSHKLLFFNICIGKMRVYIPHLLIKSSITYFCSQYLYGKIKFKNNPFETPSKSQITKSQLQIPKSHLHSALHFKKILTIFLK